MDTLLMAVTVMSLAMASAMAFLVMRLLRDERRRSDARVAALAELAAEAPQAPPAPVAKTTADRERAARLHADVMNQLAASGALEPEPDAGDLALRRDAPEVTGVGDLFSEPERSSPWGRRAAVIGALGAIVLVAAFVLPRDAQPPVAAQPAAPASAAASPAGAVPVELLSLAHAQEPGRLTVSGVVLNPRTGSPLERVTATAFAFDTNGTFLASGRAALDFTTLAPGEESPFVVTMPVTGEVARYRVGFRAEDGTVIAHVDKRSDAPTLAQK